MPKLTKSKSAVLPKKKNPVLKISPEESFSEEKLIQTIEEELVDTRRRAEKWRKQLEQGNETKPPIQKSAGDKRLLNLFEESRRLSEMLDQKQVEYRQFLARSEAEREEFQQRLGQNQVLIDDLGKTIEKMDVQISEIKTANADALKRIEETEKERDRQIELLSQKQSEYEALAVEFQRERQSHQRQMADAKARIDALGRQLEGSGREMAEIERKKYEAEDRMREIETKNLRQAELLKLKQTEYDQLVLRSRNEREHLEKEKAAADLQIREISNSLTASSRELSNLKGQKSDLEIRCRELETRGNLLQSERESQEIVFQIKQKEYEDLAAGFQTRETRLKAEAERLRQNLTALGAERDRLNETLEAKEKEYEGLTARSQAAEAGLHGEVKNLKLHLNALKFEGVLAEEKRSEAEAAIHQQAQELLAAQTRIENLTAQKREEESRHQAEREAAGKHSEDLQSRLQEISQNLAGVEEKKAEAEKQRDALEAEKQFLLKIKDELNARFAVSIEECRKVEESLAEQEKQYEEIVRKRLSEQEHYEAKISEISERENGLAQKFAATLTELDETAALKHGLETVLRYVEEKCRQQAAVIDQKEIEYASFQIWHKAEQEISTERRLRAEKNMESLQQTIQELNQKISRFEAAARESAGQFNSLKQKYQRQEEILFEKQLEYEVLFKKSHGEKERLRQDREKDQRVRQEVEARLVHLQAENQKQSELFSEKERAHRNEIEKISGQIKSLESDLHQAHTETMAVKKILQEKERLLEQIRFEYEKIQGRSRELESEVIQKVNLEELLKKQEESFRKKQSEVEALLEKSRAEIESGKRESENRLPQLQAEKQKQSKLFAEKEREYERLLVSTNEERAKKEAALKEEIDKMAERIESLDESQKLRELSGALAAEKNRALQLQNDLDKAREIFVKRTAQLLEEIDRWKQKAQRSSPGNQSRETILPFLD